MIREEDSATISLEGFVAREVHVPVSMPFVNLQKPLGTLLGLYFVERITYLHGEL